MAEMKNKEAAALEAGWGGVQGREIFGRLQS